MFYTTIGILGVIASLVYGVAVYDFLTMYSGMKAHAIGVFIGVFAASFAVLTVSNHLKARSEDWLSYE